MDLKIISHNLREIIIALDKLVLYPGYNNAKTYSNIIEALNTMASSIDNNADNDKDHPRSKE